MKTDKGRHSGSRWHPTQKPECWKRVTSRRTLKGKKKGKGAEIKKGSMRGREEGNLLL